MQSTKISFWGAVVINLNIVIGASFFLNAQNIQLKSGFMAPISWLVCGCLFAPLVVVLAKLAALYPADGGIYVYSEKILGRFWGFMSSWGYFIGATAGNAVVVRAFSHYLQQLSFMQPLLQATGLKEMTVDLLVVFIFALLNFMNIQFLEHIEVMFTLLKVIPLLLLTGGLFFLFDASNLSAPATVHMKDLLDVFPMVLFAYIGIEACCTVMTKIDDTKHRPSRVLGVSFLLIVLVYFLLQTSIFLIYGQQNVNPFLTILPQLTHNTFIIEWGNKLIYLAILSSFLGGFYGMYYYNNWNLYVLARDKILKGGSYLTKLNKNQVPWVCVFVQTFFLLVFLITCSDLYLMMISGFGVVLAYLLSALAFLVLKRSLLGFLALASCSLLLFLTTLDLFQAGFYTLMPFLIIMIMGIFLYRSKA